MTPPPESPDQRPVQQARPSSAPQGAPPAHQDRSADGQARPAAAPGPSSAQDGPGPAQGRSFSSPSGPRYPEYPRPGGSSGLSEGSGGSRPPGPAYPHPTGPLLGDPSGTDRSGPPRPGQEPAHPHRRTSPFAQQQPTRDGTGQPGDAYARRPSPFAQQQPPPPQGGVPQQPAHPGPSPRQGPLYPQQPGPAAPASPPPYPAQPAYPQQAAPGLPGAAAPAYPQQPSPPYPQAAQPPARQAPAQQPQQGAPPYPQQAGQPGPAMPAAGAPQPPPYPTAPAVPAPRQPDPLNPLDAQVSPAQQIPQAPVNPAYPHTAATLPPGPGEPAPDDPSHPHHIDTQPRRVHLTANQRRADATAVGTLVLHLPNLLGSLLVVAMIAAFFDDLAWVVLVGWLASGALVFHRPTERFLARYMFRVRRPTPQEHAKLEAIWREVTARGGIDGRAYELWIQDSDDLNAFAAAGHIVSVTRFSLNQLPNGELAAVLAHELGHHVGGHTWSGLLAYWYALPGRIAWGLMKAVLAIAVSVLGALGCLGGLVLLALAVLAGAVVWVSLTELYGLPLLLFALPYANAWVGRRAELRADRHAAVLGFAPMLVAALTKIDDMERTQRAAAEAAARAQGKTLPQESALSRLLSSHPDHTTRLHHLQPFLEPHPPHRPY